MLRTVANLLDRTMRRYMPDPFVLVIFITFITIAAALLLTRSDCSSVILAWGDGFWSLSAFTMQMVMVLLCGYIVASSRPVSYLLSAMIRKIKTPEQAIILCTLFVSLTCWFNWSLGLIVGAFICKEVHKSIPQINYRLLVASVYSGLLLWHGGFSGSIPLIIATPENFTEQLIGGVIPISETIFSRLNLILVGSLLLILPLGNYLLLKITTHESSDVMHIATKARNKKTGVPQTFAEKSEQSKDINLFDCPTRRHLLAVSY